MYITKYKKLKLSTYNYNSIDPIFTGSLNYIYEFFYMGLGTIYRKGVPEFMDFLKTKSWDGFILETVSMVIDYTTNVVYFCEDYSDYIERATTPEIEHIMETVTTLTLCKKNLIKYDSMTQDNFMHLLIIWPKYIKEKIPFLLLYLDDNDWYNLMPFETQEAMDKFVAEHTK